MELATSDFKSIKKYIYLDVFDARMYQLEGGTMLPPSKSSSFCTAGRKIASKVSSAETNLASVHSNSHAGKCKFVLFPAIETLATKW